MDPLRNVIAPKGVYFGEASGQGDIRAMAGAGQGARSKSALVTR
jgi:hypothetical protein